jgi:hypothetical protein
LFPSSQNVEEGLEFNITPSPHISEQVSCDVDEPPVQLYPGSTEQVDEHLNSIIL